MQAIERVGDNQFKLTDKGKLKLQKSPGMGLTFALYNPANSNHHVHITFFKDNPDEVVCCQDFLKESDLSDNERN